MLFSVISIISDKNIVEDGSRFDLPQIKTNGSKVIVFVKLIISFIVWVVNLWMNPFALVCWVVNLFWLPLTVHLIIPVIWFLGLWVRDVLRLVPVFWFRILWVINLLVVFPIFWFLGIWVRDFLWSKEVPISFKISTLNFLVVCLHNQSIQVSEHIIFTADILLDEEILAFVSKDDMDLLGSRSTDIRSKHDVVGTISVHI